MPSTPASQPSLHQLELLLKQHWGHAHFRSAQEPVVLAAAAGKDVLAILPTGGGKSICYQVPGLFRGGVCLVITPLIALMADQVQGLKRAGIEAAAVSAGLHPKETERTLSRFQHGPGGFLFVSPERLAQPTFATACQSMPVKTIAVDEAHCVSQWGHAFRKDYLGLSVLRRWHPEASWIALTATATPRVAGHVTSSLQLKDVVQFRMPIRRSNLAFHVEHVPNRHEAVADWARKTKGSAILYVQTRGDAEAMASLIQRTGIRAGAYHAGMDRKVRDDHQAQWIAGDLQVLACTSAFGMGIDKPDVRDIAHAHVPESPESYIQEAGRAGRDGLPAKAVILIDGRALSEADSRVRLQWPTPDQVQSVLQSLANAMGVAIGSITDIPGEVDLGDLGRKSGLSKRQVFTCLDLMERHGTLAFHSTRPLWWFQWQHDGKSPAINADGVSLEDRCLRLLPHSQAGQKWWRLNLSELAAELGADESALKGALLRLQNMAFIRISKPGERCALTFPVGRPAAESYVLPSDVLSDRVSESQIRWNAMQNYITGTSCRAVLLESSFESDTPESCGVCDLCAPSPLPTQADILAIIGKGICAAELQRIVPAVHKPHVRMLLEAMRASGDIHWDHDRFQPGRQPH